MSGGHGAVRLRSTLCRSSINQVFADRGITLPLAKEGTVDEDGGRYQCALAGQTPLYGTEIKENLADLPEQRRVFANPYKCPRLRC